MKKILFLIVLLITLSILVYPSMAEYNDRWSSGCKNSHVQTDSSVITYSSGWLTSIVIVTGTGGITIYDGSSVYGSIIYQKTTATDKNWTIPFLFSNGLYVDNSPGVYYIIEYVPR